jgi:hypothetical protein
MRKVQYRLHYAQVNVQEIEEINFESQSGLLSFIEEEINKTRKKVIYLLGLNDKPNVLVTSSKLDIITFLRYMPTWGSSGNDYFLQEYESYEEAYEVALDMAEESPLCYRKD